MINQIFGIKQKQTQKFLEDGTRIPVTEINVSGNVVAMVKNKDKNGYNSLQIGLGTKKHPSKALQGHIKGANLKVAPHFLREVRVNEISDSPKLGETINAQDVLKPGDIVDVSGVSKGKGYAGVVKRHHFKGGPRTHGQSDRERAPGSIGQTTTPGRVYKGKRMAGRMGHENVTIKNQIVADVLDNLVLIKGLVPGPKNSLVSIKKVGEDKKFVPLYKEALIEESKEPEKKPSFAKASEGKEVKPSSAKATDGKEDENAS